MIRYLDDIIILPAFFVYP
ncbi:MAG: hypothetical protein Q8910_18500 [Bacteroidota bacterium]|nr:hypothetical protein [Bacteroidota bacterium]